jgi:hypothetical protein
MQNAPNKADIRWHAVAVVTRSNCCAAAREILGCRFLTREQPPRLPLNACSMPFSCHCVYKHYPDRRLGPRRRDEEGLPRTMMIGNDERREIRGRRDDDLF